MVELNMKKIKLQKDKKYNIFSCVLNKNIPFCDNEHRPFNKKYVTNYKSIKITSKKDTLINFKSSTWKI